MSLSLTKKTFKVEYIGRTKERPGGEISAYGYYDGFWGLVLPEDVLRDFFGAKAAKPGEKESEYNVLLVQRNATPEDIKSAYRRLSRQWHPDVNNDADAQTQFVRIKKAYDILSNPLLRKRYDAGLAFQAATPAQTMQIGVFTGYRTPFKCGMLTVLGTQQRNKFRVNRILIWDDIVDQGRVMTSNWPRGAQNFEISWIGTVQDPKAKETGQFFMD